MAVQTYASISALLTPRISPPRRVTVTRLLSVLAALSPDQWQRGGIHPRRGRMTVGDFVTEMAWHDDNHLDQLRRALAGGRD
jgi:hypothetical protein